MDLVKSVHQMDAFKHSAETEMVFDHDQFSKALEKNELFRCCLNNICLARIFTLLTFTMLTNWLIIISQPNRW